MLRRTHIPILLAVCLFLLIGVPRSVLAAPTAAFVVTKTADTNDAVCDADCSLREAINAANSNAGADTITFNIPNMTGCSAANICTITLGSTLPAIGDDVTIDGAQQRQNHSQWKQSVPGPLCRRGGYILRQRTDHCRRQL